MNVWIGQNKWWLSLNKKEWLFVQGSAGSLSALVITLHRIAPAVKEKAGELSFQGELWFRGPHSARSLSEAGRLCNENSCPH